MARVWRPGQTQPCHIYRTLSTGTIEEKVFQRQISKLALASNVMSETSTSSRSDSTASFSARDLKDLFKLRKDTISETHDLLFCRCSARAASAPRKSNVPVDELNHYEHYDNVASMTEHVGVRVQVFSWCGLCARVLVCVLFFGVLCR
jgi:hypothetical protein